ncbi:hypothetical protein V6N12_045034 [Hibiscus sabdariffa]|uniref:Uncharacterized protein n=1 Tax=Hibiscus sabdariffa TaxID=183260 RepID=A0ABR2G1K5_9ROSI
MSYYRFRSWSNAKNSTGISSSTGSTDFYSQPVKLVSQVPYEQARAPASPKNPGIPHHCQDWPVQHSPMTEAAESPDSQEGDSKATISDHALRTNEQGIHDSSIQVQSTEEAFVEAPHVIPSNPTSAITNTHPMITRKKNGIVKPRVYATQYKKYGALFHRLDGRSLSSQIQGASLSSTAVVTTTSDDSANEAHVTTSRPIPYDAEQRYSRLQRDSLVSRRDKSATHFQEETQPLRRNMSSSGVEPLGIGRKWNGVEAEEDSKVSHLELSERSLAPKVAQGPNYIQPSVEDEDVCTTCLDGIFLS